MTGQPVAARPVLWPAQGGHVFDSADTSLAGANAEELRHFANNYAGATLLDLMRRLRTAEWNATEYQRQADELRATVRKAPPASLVQQVDARQKRIKALLDGGGRITRALLTAALAETDDTWNARFPQVTDEEPAA